MQKHVSRRHQRRRKMNKLEEMLVKKIPEEDLDEDDMASEFTESSAPILTTSQYIRYVRSLIKLLVGDTTLNEWIRKDFGPRQIENAAILSSSWQRPPMLIDPNGEGLVWLGRLNKLLNRRKLVLQDMENRTDPHIILGMERAITKGKPVILKNCEEVIDNFITPLIHHRNTTNVKDKEEEPRMIMFCGRRTLCHQDFRFYLSTILPKPRFSSAITSTTTLINFGVSNDTLIEDLLSRIFARIRPELYQERISGLRNLQLLKDTLFQFSHVLTNRMLTGGHENMLNSPKALQFITNITEARLQLANELSKTQNILNDLDVLKDELYPVARRGALLFALMRSLSSVRHEYQFTLNFFLQLFDEAVGGELPADFGHGPDEEDGYEEEESLSEGKKQPPRPGRESGDKQEEKQEGEGIPPIAEEESTQQTQPEGTEEELPSVELPDTITLPTQGVEYTSLSVNRIKQLMDSVTSLVFHRIRQSLLEEDHLLFRTLLCLNIQCEAGEDFSSEEMSLFLQGNPGLGMQLTLSDFDSKDSPPTWLPREKWDDIMALSVLPGPLDSLCVSFAAASDAWHDWYKSPYPEQEPLPLAESEAIEAQKKKVPEGTRGSTRQSAVGSPDLGPLNDFHQLLILRMLRPDRLPTALARYTDKHLNLNDPNEDSMNIAEVLLDARSHLGILMLLPTNTGSPDMVPESRLKLVSNPVDVLIGIAKAVNINVERVMFGDGCEFTVEEAIHSADKNDTWIVVEGLHLAPTPFFTTLRQQLQRIFKSRAIVTALRQVPYELWEELSKESNLVKGLSFGMAVIQGVLVARQLFGSAGLTRWYPFGLTQIINAIWFVIGTPLQSQEGGEPSLDDLCYCVGQLLFGSMMSNESDLTYVTALVREVLESVYRDPAAEILLGTELISTPQANVAPTEYADWFENSAGENITLGALQLHTSIEHQANDASAHQFISNMYRMHETQNMEVGDSLPQSTSSVDINKLRSALDICLEKIPILLELGQVPQLMTQEFNFPYHRPSIISMSSAASDLMPESIGYVLLQECLGMNSLLCYIRQQISDLQTSMLGGPTALPQPLLPTVYSLQEELVEFRCVVLKSQDVAEFDVDEGGLFINNMYLQGADWDFDQDTLTESKSALFHIPCLYLCPTVKPKPKLRSAEDREDEPADPAGDSQPAAGDNTTGDNTTGDNTTGDDTATGEKSAGNTARGDTDTGDGENAAEQPAAGEQAAENKPPSPAKEQEEGEQPSGANERDEQPQTIYQCPVYMNKSRQILVCKLPINCPAPEEKWILSNTAFILDRGLPEGASKKSRSYLLLQRLPPTQRAEGEEEEEENFPEEEEEDREDEGGDGEEAQPETGSEISARSQQSQLSYKAMTPQAPPLPPGLGLTREPPMINGKPGHAGETGQEAITEEKEPTTQVEADGKDGTRGEEPEIEQLDRQGEMQRGDDRVLDASKENQEEEKEKDETEVDASRKSAARAEARGEDEIKRSTPEDIKAIPPVTEDKAGRGSTGRQASKPPTNSAEKPAAHTGGHKATKSPTYTGVCVCV
nr:hypothetical protein BaRGS_015768 [Batillaria attramentaria]